MRTVRAVVSFLVASLLVLGAEAAAARPCEPDGVDADAVTAARALVRKSCGCAAASSHGAYVACIATALDAEVAASRLPKVCRGRIASFAARSTCGRSPAVTCCVQRPGGPWRGQIRRAPDHCRPLEGGGSCLAIFPHLDDACTTETGCRHSTCGDGIVDPGNGEACEPPGSPGCDESCQVVPGCGDGVLELFIGEQCEPPGTATCDASCQFIHTCGNGVIEPGEECDGQPGCGTDCLVPRSLCCSLGGACLGGAATNGFDAYNFGKACFIVGGTGSFGVCEGTEPCPPPAPPFGCVIGSCGDQPIDPLPLCCQHVGGTCDGTVATSAAAVGAFGCLPFPPPPTGDIDRLVVGSCGADGRCVPAE